MKPGVLSVEFAGGQKVVAPKELTPAINAMLTKRAIPHDRAFLYGRATMAEKKTTLYWQFASLARYLVEYGPREIKSSSNVSCEQVQAFGDDVVSLARQFGFDEVTVTFPDIRASRSG